ncbi:MAG: zinc-ribbon domain-containing protein [Alphaproteobacteria bacterium]|nr:zinc-ribbon domain-containing protein [Alphaproteobacteria bacterium]
MILTCPQCNTRYELDAQRLAPGGHRVKCTNCSHIWYQEAREGASEAPQQESGFNDIPDSVKPFAEYADIPAFITEPIPRKTIPPQVLAGYGAAAAVFVLVFGLLIALKGSMVSAWPASALLYEKLGMAVAVPGEGLIFDGVTVTTSPSGNGGQSLKISGHISNLMEEEREIPLITAELHDDKGEVLEHWLIEMDQTLVPPGGQAVFSASYPAAHSNGKSVRIFFGLGNAKTAAADGDSNPVPLQDGQAHPSGGAEGGESP